MMIRMFDIMKPAMLGAIALLSILSFPSFSADIASGGKTSVKKNGQN
ncbi:MAG: hypothetical protein GY920_08910, partial [Aliivibrio sp.]|nr:hypothetical protein [Aliivibrio sp.]